MRAVVIYESLTGNTARAARLVAEEVAARGVEVSVYPIGDIGLPRPIHIAGVATGGAEAASIMLVNASPTIRAAGALRFFDESGQPWPVAVN